MGAILLGSMLCMASPGAVDALVVANTDDDIVLRAPENVEGWERVGACGALTAVYLGNGWVLTASHVGTHEFVLATGTHQPVPGSWRALRDPEGGSLRPDLAVFRVTPRPALPDATIRDRPIVLQEPVVLVASGLGRGQALRWRGLEGFEWGGNRARRWGTNRVQAVGRDFVLAGRNTRGFQLLWEPGKTRYEAQAAHGDSGGAVFVQQNSKWQLGGILFSIGTQAGQPRTSSMPGNTTQAADLSHYRGQLEALLGRGNGRGP
ncbi:serine protease [Myxococcota bacterium]|nr:serine protease [Myxococcota bacterium]